MGVVRLVRAKGDRECRKIADDLGMRGVKVGR